MKSHVIYPSVSAPQKVVFPVLAKINKCCGCGDDYIVLFEGPNLGTCVSSQNPNYLGKSFACKFSEQWWEVLPKGVKVTLEN
jgi:hypothetical protein